MSRDGPRGIDRASPAAAIPGSIDWVARPITLPDDPGAERQAASPLLRRAFDLDADVVSARLHVTALGVHQVRINGRLVSEDLLAPGWTPYERRLIADTYEVTTLLVAGSNVITAMIGDGWYRGRLGWRPDGDRCHYGDQIGLIAQLEVTLADGRSATIATDGAWRATTGEVLAADLYDGCMIDLRERRIGWDALGFDDRDWKPARVLDLDPAIIEPRVAPPVRRIAELSIEVLSSDETTTRLDACQNVSGWVRLVVRGERGTSVVVRHAEVLEPDGSLHTRSLRSAKATDTYVLADDEVTVLEPMFTFHGFRYAEIETEAEILEETVVAISSDTPPRGAFACSDPALTRLYENVVWSQRDNFVSVPTDCPQRDERLGWTGDAQAFAPTACTLFDAEAFLASWLRDLDLEQDDELGVPSVVPDVVLAGAMRYGRAGWADAATIVPWAVYEAYGHPRILSDQRSSMRRWVDSLVARRGPDGLLPASPQFGDWLDPDAPGDRPWEAKVDATYLANAFFAHSARLLAEAIDRLEPGHADAIAYHRLSDEIAALTWGRWRDHAVSSQTGCAAAIELGIAPASDRAAVAAALAKLVRDADGRVSTGFLGTPLVLPALAAFGHFDEAYRMLLRREAPSWLYQVDQGATTVWERWDAILPDGSIHPGRMAPNPVDPDGREGHMLSFNHYAYGAVVDWMFRHLAGLAPDRDDPGYRLIRFAPRPPAAIAHASASVETAFGRAAIAWRIDDALMTIEVDVPPGATAIVDPPSDQASVVTLDGVPLPAVSGVRVDPGHHTMTITEPRIALRSAAVPAAASGSTP